MGQAKHRKAKEPNYGKIKEPSKMRGLIISCPVEIQGEKEIYSWNLTQLDPQDLRFSLFFWDRLCWPKPAFDLMPTFHEASFLEEAGVLDRPTYLHLGNRAKSMIKTYLTAFEDYEKSQPGMWAFGTGLNSIKTQTELFIEEQGTAIELQRSIPIPTEDVPLEEILEFRQRRRDELLLFRSYIENLATEINSSSDSVDALKKAQRNIDEACKNLMIVTREWRAPIYLANFSSNFNLDLKKAATSAYAAWLSLSEMGLPETTSIIGAGITGLQSQISIKSDIKFRSFKKATSPFKYAYSISKQF